VHGVSLGTEAALSDIPVTQTTSLSRLPTTIAQLYQARYTFWTAQLALLEAQVAKLMESPVEQYYFAGGDGQQQARRRDLDQVSNALSRAEKMANYYWRKLHGYGNVSMVLRRR
jgi:hypothetical protein